MGRNRDSDDFEKSRARIAKIQAAEAEKRQEEADARENAARARFEGAIESAFLEAGGRPSEWEKMRPRLVEDALAAKTLELLAPTLKRVNPESHGAARRLRD
jgi:hypothetical protein